MENKPEKGTGGECVKKEKQTNVEFVEAATEETERTKQAERGEKEPGVGKWKSPAYAVRPVPIEQIEPNTYNPNAVAPPEMRLLYESIREDGYTMPIVCYYDAGRDLYVIVDGFHRYRIMREHPDIYEREEGKLPVVVIDKPLSNRMASTIRHNRARGSHDVDLMSNIVKELHEIGRTDAWIARHLGMDQDEILRLKQLTGLMSLFKDVSFGQAWRPVDEKEDEEAMEEALAAEQDFAKLEAAAEEKLPFQP